MTSSSPRLQARRLFVLSAIASVALTACQTGPRRGPVAPPPPQKLEVAVLVPLTGEDAAVGEAISNAAKLALFDTNNQQIQLSIFNTAEGGAAAAASRALAQGNQLILGPLLSDEVRAVAPLAQRARVPVIAYSNDAQVAAPGVYILGFSPAQAIERVVLHARQQGATRFAALVPAGMYGERSSRAFLSAVQRAGGQAVAVETYGTVADARAAARRLGNRGAVDAVLIADGGRAAASIAPSVRVGPRLLGTELWASDRTLGSTARLRGAWYAAAPDARFQQLVTRYRARYGKAPMRLASLGYDSMLLTVRAARTWQPGRRFPVRALNEPEGFAGVDGIFRFGRDNVAQRAFEVRQVTSGGSTVVSPAPGSFPN
ncbi:penicillin-binding protein activator [Sphingomonas arenae]|uniref:penicillin-binding protein activator n=1 Tax=Sphingomonas arenae TaxID=2812555 RepID=UPI001966CF86|nr:penicillin-binding protein activator [Sphingomonas arenae]